jgi:hypothetical protein
VQVPKAFKVILWDEYFGPRYGEPNAGTLAAVKLLASQEGLLLDPVYTARPWPACWTASVASALKTGRSFSCIPVGHRRCLPMTAF